MSSPCFNPGCTHAPRLEKLVSVVRLTGDDAGIPRYRSPRKFGIAERLESHATDYGLWRRSCGITCAVTCLLPKNKSSSVAIGNCYPCLRAKLAGLPPQVVFPALGRVAHGAVRCALDLKFREFPFRHGAGHQPEPHLLLLDTYHCSRYSIQTIKRLPIGMYERVIASVRRRLDLLDLPA